jgi:hypothetical protein
MKRPFVTVLVVIAAVVGGVMGKDVARHYLDNSDDIKSEQYLTRLSNEMNRKMPMLVDKETELFSTLGLQEVFVYNYRFVNVNVNQVNTDKLMSTLREQVQGAACLTPQTRDAFLKKGVTLRYTYYDSKKTYIGSLDVRPTDCGF